MIAILVKEGEISVSVIRRGYSDPLPVHQVFRNLNRISSSWIRRKV